MERKRDPWRHELIARLEAASRMVETARGPIEVADVGEGRPVLFVHGAPGGCDRGTLVARQFAGPDVRWIGPSRPGYLRTPLSVGERLEEQADALAALLDTMGFDRLPVFAHSTGAAVAVHFAARHPERCAGLVLAAGVSRPLRAARAARRAIGSLPPLMTAAELPSYGSAWMLRRLGATLARIRPGRAAPPELDVLSILAETMLPADRRAAGFVNDILQLAALAPLPYDRVLCPALLVHGTGDVIVPVSHSRAAVTQLASAELHLVPAGQHYGIYLPSASLRESILAFLRKAA